MFFEVHVDESPTEDIGSFEVPAGVHVPEDLKHMFTERFDYLKYRTSLSLNQTKDALISLQLSIQEELVAGKLGGIGIEHYPESHRIHTVSMYPYGHDLKEKQGQLHFRRTPWKVYLTKKGIAAAVEFFLLSQFDTSYTVSRDVGSSDSRKKQLEKYGIADSTPITDHLKRLERSLSSPYFDIVQFPSWVRLPI